MLFWSLTVLVLLAPIAFGAIRPWTAACLAAGVATLLVIWSLERLIGGRPPAVRARHVWLPLMLFAGVLAWLAIQAAPFTPAAWHHPYWAQTAALLGEDIDGTISLDPEESWFVILRLMTYGGVFWLSLQLCRSPTRARQVYYSVAVAGLVYALYGLGVNAYELDMVVWEKKEFYHGSLTSTFINRNSYATYAGLGLVCALGLLLNEFLSQREAGLGPRALLRSATEYVQRSGWLLVAAAGAITVALLLTKSRAGLASTLVGIIVLLAVPWVTGAMRLRAAAALAGFVLALGLGSFALSGEGVFSRLFEISGIEGGRDKIFVMTLNAIPDAPWRGIGAGTFEQAIPAYRTEELEIGLQYYVNRAHNSYLENALEFGIPAAAAFNLGLLLIVAHRARGIRRRRRDALFPGIGVAATVLVGVHSMFDFSLQIPAVAACYALILGAAAAQSWSSVEET